MVEWGYAREDPLTLDDWQLSFALMMHDSFQACQDGIHMRLGTGKGVDSRGSYDYFDNVPRIDAFGIRYEDALLMFDALGSDVRTNPDSGAIKLCVPSPG